MVLAIEVITRRNVRIGPQADVQNARIMVFFSELVGRGDSLRIIILKHARRSHP
jgi:hypothetical protein